MKHTNLIPMHQPEKIQNKVQTDSIQNTVTDYTWPQEKISLLEQPELLTDTFEICQPVTLSMPYSKINTGKNLTLNLIFTIIFLAIFAVIRLRGKDLITDIIYATIQRKKATPLLNEGILPNLLFYCMGLTLSFSVLSVFITYLTTQTFLSIHSLLIFGGLLLYHLILIFIIHLLGWTFSTKQIANEFTVNLWTFHISLGLLISPFVIALFFVRENAVYPLIITTIICLTILMLVKIVRWLAIFFSYKVSILYMILYLCALELVPLLFLYKAVV